MKYIYTGEQVPLNTQCGCDANLYPRLDEQGNPLPGHGVYILSGWWVDETRLLNSARKIKKKEVDKKYQDENSRVVIFGNNSVIVNENAIQGIDAKRRRVTDNGDITEILWFFDDKDPQTGNKLNIAQKLNQAQTEELHRKITDKDQYLRALKYVHYNNIEALTTVEEVQNYNIDQSITDTFTGLTNATWSG